MSTQKYYAFGEEKGDYICTRPTSVDNITSFKCKKCSHAVTAGEDGADCLNKCVSCAKKELKMKSEAVINPEALTFRDPPKPDWRSPDSVFIDPPPLIWPSIPQLSTPLPVLIPQFQQVNQPEYVEVTILKEMIEQAGKDFQALSNTTFTHQGLAMHMISRTQQGLKNLLKLLESKNV